LARSTDERQILNIVYLVRDIVVVVGLNKGSWIGVGAFFLAAMSQIMLYTISRDWVLDAPADFQRIAGSRNLSIRWVRLGRPRRTREPDPSLPTVRSALDKARNHAIAK